MLQNSALKHNTIRLIQHRMRVQRQSEGIKKGNPKDHEQAVQNVIKFLSKQNPNMDIYTEWYVNFNHIFCRDNKLRPDYGHSYDIALLVPDGRGVVRTIFIEVDGEKHSKTNQKINDGIAEKYAQENKIQLIRLDKTECLGDKEDRDVYLMRVLWKYLK